MIDYIYLNNSSAMQLLYIYIKLHVFSHIYPIYSFTPVYIIESDSKIRNEGTKFWRILAYFNSGANFGLV